MDNSIVNNFLSKILSYLESAEAFLKAEIPAFVQEFMNWHLYEAIFYLSIWVISAVICFALALKFSKLNTKYRLDNRDRSNSDYEGMCVTFIVFGLCLILSSCINIHTIIKLKVAPRVFLLEEVRDMTTR